MTRQPNPAVLKGIAMNVSQKEGVSLALCEKTLKGLVDDGTIIVDMTGQAAINILCAKVRIGKAEQDLKRAIARGPRQ